VDERASEAESGGLKQSSEGQVLVSPKAHSHNVGPMIHWLQVEFQVLRKVRRLLCEGGVDG